MGQREPTHGDLRVEAALWNVRIDSAAVEVMGALASAGADSIILKGPALSDWYPADAAQTYVDADIWVAPNRQDVAASVLAGLGFERQIDEQGLPDWWQEHASSWRRALDVVSVDLHRKLQGVGRDPQIVWTRLWAQSEPFQVAGREVRRLDPAARALYVTLHAAHDGRDGLKAQQHLDMALSNASAAVWDRAVQLAGEFDAVDAFSAGLSLTESGRELAGSLGLPTNRSIEAAIRASTAPPVALGFQQLASARGWRRLHILLRKLFPPPGFIRHWWPPARRGTVFLVVGYLYRPIWLLRHAPAGYRAWRAARRAVRRD